jgi:hypothetical protein
MRADGWGARMNISATGEPLLEDDLRKLEEKLAAQLPPSFRKFLRDYNGGVPDPRHFRWGRGAYQDSSVRFFFHLWSEKPADPYSIEWNLATYQGEDERIPRDLLPIASDEGGNRVCIGITGTRRGKIFFWDHERESESNPDSAVKQVKPSFPAFIKSLHTPEEDIEGNIWDSMNAGDYERLGRLFDEGLSPDYVFIHHRLTLLEYSAMYRETTLTELVLRKGARKNIQNALRIAIERGNTVSESLIREAIGSD